MLANPLTGSKKNKAPIHSGGFLFTQSQGAAFFPGKMLVSVNLNSLGNIPYE